MEDETQPDAGVAARRLSVFLCHSSDDKPAVHQLWERLRDDGYAPWLDEEDILPGRAWEKEIPKAIRSSDVVLVCLSKTSVSKAGYLQKEILYSLDIAAEQPEDVIYIIPVRLEECKVPERLAGWQRVDLFKEHGYLRLTKALRERANQVTPPPPTRSEPVQARVASPAGESSPQAASPAPPPPASQAAGDTAARVEAEKAPAPSPESPATRQGFNESAAQDAGRPPAAARLGEGGSLQSGKVRSRVLLVCGLAALIASMVVALSSRPSRAPAADAQPELTLASSNPAYFNLTPERSEPSGGATPEPTLVSPAPVEPKPEVREEVRRQAPPPASQGQDAPRAKKLPSVLNNYKIEIFLARDSPRLRGFAARIQDSLTPYARQVEIVSGASDVEGHRVTKGCKAGYDPGPEFSAAKELTARLNRAYPKAGFTEMKVRSGFKNYMSLVLGSNCGK